MKKLARDDFASKRSITHAILGLFQEAYWPAFHASSAIVDSFVIVSFFLEKHYIQQYYRLLTCYTFVPDYANVLVKVVVTLGVINRAPAAIPEHNVFLLLRSCAYLYYLGKFSGLNRASKIKVGLETGSDL